MLSNAKLKKIIDDAEKKGYKLKIRDVAYAYLCTHFENTTIAYKVVYGEDVLDTQAFDSKPAIAYIKDQIKYSLVAATIPIVILFHGMNPLTKNARNAEISL